MDVYTVEQTAEIMSVGVATIQRWLRCGTLHGSKVGRLWRITPTDIDQMLQSTKS